MIKSYTVGGNLMNYYEPLLLTPGPTQFQRKSIMLLGLPMVGHRSPDFESIAKKHLTI